MKPRTTHCKDCEETLNPNRPAQHGTRCPHCYNKHYKQLNRQIYERRKKNPQPLSKKPCKKCGQPIGGRHISEYCKAHRHCEKCSQNLVCKQSASLCKPCYRQARNKSNHEYKERYKNKTDTPTDRATLEYNRRTLQAYLERRRPYRELARA